jgi:uncharacterized protein YndB with AHSA1/START domain
MNTQTTTDPVRRTITVKQSVADAFTLFTGRIGAWWPQAGDPASPGPPATPRTPVLEPRPGGRIYDHADDGTIVYWGEVLVWEPPHRLVLAWQPTDDAPATEVEITFTPEGTGTRIELEHRGWERLTGDASAARDQYDTHWDDVLRVYAAGGQENGHAIAALLLGITSIVVPLLGLLAAPFGIVFGVLGKRRARKGARHGGIATAGLTLAAIGLVLWGVLLLGGAALLVASPECHMDGLAVACGGEEAVPVPPGTDALEPGVDEPVPGELPADAQAQ